MDDYVRLVCEISLVVMFVYYFFHEFIKIYLQWRMIQKDWEKQYRKK